jgi:hypothetical protein
MRKTRRARRTPFQRVAEAFDREALARICEMPEEDFAEAFGLTVTDVPRPKDGFFAFGDRDADVLAVAHLDTVARASNRRCTFVESAAGPVVFSRALDDRLGAYVILDLLPKLGITTDLLLTVGEEQGQSTAAFFRSDKQYDWMIEFDRGGTDVVLYEYHCDDLVDRVGDAGAEVDIGSFSDIAELEHLGCKGMNWGVGYQDYHSARSHAFLNDTFEMVAKFLDFHEQNAGQHLKHAPYGSEYLDDDEYWAYESGFGRSATDRWGEFENPDAIRAALQAQIARVLAPNT